MTSTDALTIRRAGARDAAAVDRLAALDSSRAPRGELLVAELDGRAVAALSLADGHVVADPFAHTADVVELLRVRARAARPRRGRRRLVALARRSVASPEPV